MNNIEGYSASSDGYVIPDLIVDKIDGQYRVFLNDTGVPRLRLSRSYREQVPFPPFPAPSSST